MEAGCGCGLGFLSLGGLALFVVGCVVVAGGWAGLLGGGRILLQCHCISGSCMVAITGKEVGKGG